MAVKGYLLSESAVKKTAAVVKAFQEAGTNNVGTRPKTREVWHDCILAKITAGTTVCSWTQAQIGTGGSWSVNTSTDAMFGTTSVRPAYLPTGTATSYPDLTGQYCVLVRATDTSNNACFVITGVEGPGYSGTVTCGGIVTWTGTVLQQPSTPLVYVNGILTTVGSATTITIDTPDTCT